MTAPAGSPWLEVGEVVEYARCGRNQVLRALADGSLRGSQLVTGGKWRIHRADVDAWLRGETPAPLTAPSVTRRIGRVS